KTCLDQKFDLIARECWPVFFENAPKRTVNEDNVPAQWSPKTSRPVAVIAGIGQLVEHHCNVFARIFAQTLNVTPAAFAFGNVRLVRISVRKPPPAVSSPGQEIGTTSVVP